MWNVPPGRLSGLFAQFRIDWEMIGLAVLAAAFIFTGVVAVVRVRNWRTEAESPPTLAEQIESYQKLVDQGELDPAEFQRIKAQLEQPLEKPPQ